MKIAVLAGGCETELDWLLPELVRCERIICADSGWRVARQLGLAADFLVGDLDSLDPAEVEQARAGGVCIEQHPPHKDESDLELALHLASRLGAQEVLLVNALGGRLDHQTFNLVSGLCLCRSLGLRATLLSRECRAFLVWDGHELTAQPGQTCSIQSLAEESTGIWLEGFAYPLEGGSLRRDRSRGLSNQLTAGRARIRVGSGLLLVFLLPGPA